MGLLIVAIGAGLTFSRAGAALGFTALPGPYWKTTRERTPSLRMKEIHFFIRRLPSSSSGWAFSAAREVEREDIGVEQLRGQGDGRGRGASLREMSRGARARTK